MLLKYFLLPTALLLGAGSAATGSAGISSGTSAQRAGNLHALILPSMMRNASLGSGNLQCNCGGQEGVCPSPDDTSCCVQNGNVGCCAGPCFECGASDCGGGPAPSPPSPRVNDDDNGSSGGGGESDLEQCCSGIGAQCTGIGTALFTCTEVSDYIVAISCECGVTWWKVVLWIIALLLCCGACKRKNASSSRSQPLLS